MQERLKTYYVTEATAQFVENTPEAELRMKLGNFNHCNVRLRYKNGNKQIRNRLELAFSKVMDRFRSSPSLLVQ
nr:DUF3898 domain-containing protein [Peribacillus simplex]